MAEYVLAEDDNQEEAVKRLLAEADDPNAVTWSPRPNTPHGGVYIVPDPVAEKVLAARRAEREAEAKRISDAQAAADKRDGSEAVSSGLATPEEAGFPADLPVADDDSEDGADEATVDDPSTPNDEHAEAQDRVAKRRAARKAAATSADEQKSE